MRVSDWQKQIGDWARRVFPNATEDSILAHLRHEVNKELVPGCAPDELADVVLLVMHLANMRGINLEHEIHRKHIINTKREWATEPNDEGFFPHTKEHSEPLWAGPSALWTCPRCRVVYKSKRADHPGYCHVCMIGDKSNAE